MKMSQYWVGDGEGNCDNYNSMSIQSEKSDYLVLAVTVKDFGCTGIGEIIGAFIYELGVREPVQLVNPKDLQLFDFNGATLKINHEKSLQNFNEGYKKD